MKGYLRILMVTLLAGNSSVLKSQTCIILNATSEEITLGTDSKSVREKIINKENKFSVEKSNSLRCNIHKAGNFYYSLSGHDLGIDSIIERSSMESSSFDMMMHISRYKIQQYLENIFEPVRLSDPGFIASNYPEVQFVQFFFYGFEKNTPRATAVWFELPGNMEYPLKINAGFKEIINNHASLGVHDTFENEFDKTNLWQNDPQAAISYFISKQLQKTPDPENGINFITITKNKVSWSPANNKCHP